MTRDETKAVAVTTAISFMVVMLTHKSDSVYERQVARSMRDGDVCAVA